MKHGELETWWKEQFGYGFDRLTESEARYLARVADADTIRDKILAAKQETLNSVNATNASRRNSLNTSSSNTTAKVMSEVKRVSNAKGQYVGVEYKGAPISGTPLELIHRE